jgi:hypothetical protein
MKEQETSLFTQISLLLEMETVIGAMMILYF